MLADELCTKYSLELSDLELEDISELATTDIAARGTDELPNGNDNILCYLTILCFDLTASQLFYVPYAI